MWVVSSLTSTFHSYLALIIAAVVTTKYVVVALKDCMISMTMRRYKSRRPTYPGKRLVVITGCDSGFGKLLAKTLAHDHGDDFDVLALTLTKEAAQELNKLSHANLKASQCNVTDPVQIRNTVQQFVMEGDGQNKKNLYALINNAGIVDTAHFCMLNDLQMFEKVLQVNFMGQVRMTHALLPALINHKGSRIINISSVEGTVATPGLGSYAASKYAVEGWSESLRRELLPLDVHVVLIRPGSFRTGMLSTCRQRFLDNYEQASEFGKSVVGGDRWRDQILANFEDFMQRESPPEQVVRTMVNILEDPYPWHIHEVGLDAHTIFRALRMLPYPVADAMANLMIQKPIVDED